MKFEGEHANTVLAKQLFMHDKKKKENMWLICADVNNNFDLKDLNKYLPVKSGDLRAADEESLMTYLGCIKGLVNYFAMINDVDKKVKIIIDKKLMDAEFVSFHPMSHHASTAIPKDAILKLKDLAGRDDTNFEILDFATIAGGVQAAKPEASAAGGDKKGKPAQG